MRPAEQPRAALGTAYLVTPRRTIVHLQHLYRSHGKRSVRRDFWVSFKIGLCSDLVGMAGFEPAASCSQSRRANQAAPHPADRSVAYRPACYCPGRSPSSWSALATSLVSCCRQWSFGAGQSCGYAIGAHLAGTSSPRQTCGRSSMAEPQPSKLVMRVRFPSPAPTE